MARTAQGRWLLQSVEQQITAISVDYEKITKNNVSVTESVRHNVFRKAFFKCLKRNGISALVAKYCGTGMAPKIRRMLTKMF